MDDERLIAWPVRLFGSRGRSDGAKLDLTRNGDKEAGPADRLAPGPQICGRNTPSIGRYGYAPAVALALALFTLFCTLLRGGAAPAAETLRSADQIRRLSPAEAAKGLPVHLRAVVTFYDEALYSRFVQDETAGIYLREMNNMPALVPGQIVEIRGVTSPGEYVPIILPQSVEVIGEGPLPAARPVSVEQLVSGHEDSQFVEFGGIVRFVRFEEETKYFLIDVATGGERFTAYVRDLPGVTSAEMVDSHVRIRGVCSTLFNRQRQLFGIRILAPRPEDVIIEEKGAGNPFDIPTQSISSLLQFTTKGTFGHRVKVSASVVYYEPGTAMFIQDEQSGLYCQTRQRGRIQPGDLVEVLGFPAKGEYSPVLQDASYRKIGSGPSPQPTAINLDQALSGIHDCRLVRINASVVERTQRGREQYLVLETEGFVFPAFLAQNEGGTGFSRLQNGSEVAVTGVCLIERGSSWRAGEGWRARSFRLLLRSPADVVVLKTPPWWTLRRVLLIAAVLAVVTLAAFAWVAVLRRRVQKQTAIIQQKLQTEATLKERYEALFENANDMVFTLDSGGAITSINSAGERLLQRRRDGLLRRNILEFVAEDQRAAARQWLAQAVQETELPTAEWDFTNPAGQRLKLEISTRTVLRDGQPLELEGIARDITERRRLEREILEISNREQRRIGHDLHDGVCQQLAGIAYRLSILGDRIQEKGQDAAAEAEEIERLIHETNSQARTVARGLFPVRLEESGLVAALEELAEGLSSRYAVQCRFESKAPGLEVDNEVALHLYFIAQEALLNAIRHGGASKIGISLNKAGEGFELAVQDNGKGFKTPAAGQPGMGIRIMRYRARVIGANLEILSQPGQGTRISCVFSLATREILHGTKDDRDNQAQSAASR